MLTLRPKRMPVAPPSGDREDDIGSLARQLARGYAELVEAHRRSWGITPAEAEEKARMPRDRALEMVRTDPVEQMAWWTLATAMEHDPDAALDGLEADRRRRAPGVAQRPPHRPIARTAATPWDRARFLALREAFRDDWRPARWRRVGPHRPARPELREYLRGWSA